MDALGMIETKGLVAAIESADVMLKAADVSLLERVLVGGGLVTVTVTGDVAAVKSSIDAAAAAVSRLGPDLLISQHVIPRPHVELGETIISSVPLCEKLRESEKCAETEQCEEPVKEEAPEDVTVPEETVIEESVEEVQEELPETLETIKETEIIETTEPEQLQVAEMHKADMDRLVAEKGVDKAVEIIGKCKVVKLRNLAREYEDFGIAGREISKANKTELLEEFRKYYS